MPLWEVLRYFSLLSMLCIGVVTIVGIQVLSESNMPMMLSLALLEMALAVLTFIIAGYGLSRMLGIRESSEIWGYIKWQLHRIPSIKKTLARNQSP